MGDVFEEYSEKNHEELPPLTIIQGKGTILREESDRNLQYDKNSLSGYKLVHKDDFIVHLRSFEGGLEKANSDGIVSPAYHMFHGNSTDSRFYYPFFRSRQFISVLLKPHIYGIRDGKSIDIAGMKTIMIPVPSYEEQVKIGDLIESLDTAITLHQCMHYPHQICRRRYESISFYRHNTTAWEQRKFGELVLIERGGSPRPIDDYITDSPDGLNWIKIGDAPEHGRYINSTKEKIRPEGLSKTRQVQPGDLILSNSMSFGRPYIMGIHGCIHDGWLLIRDEHKKFDLTFLCHMLGTDQMLDQYRMYAAGSTVNNLNKELVGNTTVSIPSMTEQKQIGQFFEHMDDAITLHQRNNSQ